MAHHHGDCFSFTSIARTVVLVACVSAATANAAPAQTQQSLTIRGRNQVVHLYGPRTGTPVIVSSGDGGWIHLAPHVAGMLAADGFFVVGFDVRAYLASFTTGGDTLRVEDEPFDYKVLVDFAAR